MDAILPIIIKIYTKISYITLPCESIKCSVTPNLDLPYLFKIKFWQHLKVFPSLHLKCLVTLELRLCSCTAQILLIYIFCSLHKINGLNSWTHVLFLLLQREHSTYIVLHTKMKTIRKSSFANLKWFNKHKSLSLYFNLSDINIKFAKWYLFGILTKSCCVPNTDPRITRRSYITLR